MMMMMMMIIIIIIIKTAANQSYTSPDTVTVTTCMQYINCNRFLQSALRSHRWSLPLGAFDQSYVQPPISVMTTVVFPRTKPQLFASNYSYYKRKQITYNHERWGAWRKAPVLNYHVEQICIYRPTIQFLDIESIHVQKCSSLILDHDNLILRVVHKL
jgi:hypothetical protein